MSDKLSFHDRQHIQKMLAHEQIIASIFNHFVASVSPDLKKWTDTGKNNVWVRNASVEKAIDKRLIGLQADLINVIDNFQMDAWNRSNLKNDKLVKQYIKDMAISEATKKGLFAQNLDMLKEFQNRKEAGMNLSANIWDIAGQTKSQLEFYLESGLSVGRSAATISQDIRQILNDPDKKFHRIKDKNGHLVMSQPMKDYHPGQGQYRSSAMNAKRVAVTETNMMYRKADSARWAEMDFVMGFEVSRSGSNSGACSICDPLTGPYPKGFVYAGWHPFCICPATPILLKPEEFAEYLHTDQIPSDKIITTLPVGMNDFIKLNTEALKNANNVPYWIRDNFKDGDVSKGISFPVALPKAQPAVTLQSDKLTKAIAKAEKQIKKAEKIGDTDLTDMISALSSGISGKDITSLNAANKAMTKALKQAKESATFKQPTPAELEKLFGKQEADNLLISFNKHLSKKGTAGTNDYLKYLDYEIKWIKDKTLTKYPTSPKLVEMLEKEVAATKQQITLSEAKELKTVVVDTKALIKANSKAKSDILTDLIGQFKDAQVANADLHTIKQLNTDISNEIQHIRLLKDIKKAKKNTKADKYSLEQFFTKTEQENIYKLENDLEIELLKPSNLRNDSKISALGRELSDERKKLGIKYREVAPVIEHIEQITDLQYDGLCAYLRGKTDILSDLGANDVYNYLLDVERAATRRYTGSYYNGLNSYLRGEGSAKMAKEYDAFKIICNRSLEKLPRFEGMCWRGAYVDDKVVNAIKSCMNDGKLWEYPAFQSSSRIKGANFSGNVTFGIKSKAGAIIEDISKYSNEKEVLFRAGSKFKVHKVESKEGNWYIELEEIL